MCDSVGTVLRYSGRQPVHESLTLPYKMAEGLNRYQGYNILEGTTFAPESELQLGSSPTLQNPPPLVGNGYLFGQATDWVRNFITKNPNLAPLSFDIYNPGVYQQTLIDQSSIVGAYSSDLSAFRARGGKVILLQGLMDTAVSPNATIDWCPRNSALVTSRRSSGPIIAFWVSSRAHRRAALGRLLAFLIPIASP